MSPGRTTHFFGNDLKRCLDNFPNFLYINFSNIRGIRSNFNSLEQNLSFYKNHLFFLTETQVSGTTDSKIYSVPFQFLYPKFRSKAGSCVYVRDDITCSRADDLDSSEFSNFNPVRAMGQFYDLAGIATGHFCETT